MNKIAINKSIPDDAVDLDYSIKKYFKHSRCKIKMFLMLEYAY